MNDMSSSITGLIVEDEWLLRMELSDALSEAGWRIREAGTGDEAIDLMEREASLQFLITDIRLPGQADGWAVAEHFHRLWPRALVVYVSGSPDRPGRRVPGSLFLSKPVTMERVLDACLRQVSPGLHRR